MGTSGVPWNATKEQIIEAIKKHKGVLSRVCKELDCCYDTVRKRIDVDKEIRAILDSERQGFDNMLVDTAEDTLLYALSRRGDDLGNSLKSAFFILNNKGKERGYAHPSSLSEDDSLNVKQYLISVATNKSDTVTKASE